MNPSTLHPKFLCIAEQMEALFQKLLSMPLKKRGTWRAKDIPLRGVYVFYENSIPMYVGRSNRMHCRILEHGRKGSSHNDASFAWKLSHYEAKISGFPFKGTRKELSTNIDFISSFLNAKKRVSEMDIRWVHVDDANTQCVFEIYATLALNAPHNDFENH